MVTTSRDPSARARRFGRALASFLSLPYVSRGKQSLGDEGWLVVVEDHGNPSGLIRRSPNMDEEHLAFTLLGDPARGRLIRAVPVVVGQSEDAQRVARFLELQWLAAGDPRRAISVSSGTADFLDAGESRFMLRL